MYFGADYYPEHWPKQRWAEDARLMKDAGINLVRMAEFAWAKMEIQEGQYDFSWLDESIEILSREGIKVVLGTPTATPPKWLMDKNPEIYMKDAYGRVRGFGSRRHYCHNNPTYREYTRKIVSRMAEHYKDNPNVVAWQIDNEFGCHDTTHCYCEHCLQAFRNWLQNKYGTIDLLNEEWGTVFWSQTYRDWDEVILPSYTVCEGLNNRPYSHNPGLLLDYFRFASDSVVSYQKIQIDVLKEYVKQPITHNMMGHFSDIDYFNLGKDLDFVSLDSYPASQWNKNTYMDVSMAHDLMRGIKNKNYWVMEEKSGPCGWNTLDGTPAPGLLRLWTYQALAHGAEAIVYFRWRACRFGTEEYWYGILDHDGIPRRRYREICQIGSEMKQLSDWFVGSKVMSEVAIIKSYDNCWSHNFQPHSPKFNYNKLLMDYYNALAVRNINVDVTGVWVDLSKYKMVIVPAFNLMNNIIAEKLRQYANQGGTLVVTFRSGTRTWNNAMITETLPGVFKDMAGVEVEEFDSLNGSREVRIAGPEIGEGTAAVWCDILKPLGAQVIASYNSEFYCGKAAVTLHQYGKGKVCYVGCDLNSECLKLLMSQLSDAAGVEPALNITVEGVEVVRKEKDGKTYLVILNHNNTMVDINVQGEYTDLLSRDKIKGSVSLPAYGVAILA